MQTSGWIQLALFVVALAAITKPMGLYLLRVLDANGQTWLDPVLKPFERLTYRLLGVDAGKVLTHRQILREVWGAHARGAYALSARVPGSPAGEAGKESGGPHALDHGIRRGLSVAANAGDMSFFNWPAVRLETPGVSFRLPFEFRQTCSGGEQFLACGLASWQAAP